MFFDTTSHVIYFDYKAYAFYQNKKLFMFYIKFLWNNAKTNANTQKCINIHKVLISNFF